MRVSVNFFYRLYFMTSNFVYEPFSLGRRYIMKISEHQLITNQVQSEMRFIFCSLVIFAYLHGSVCKFVCDQLQWENHKFNFRKRLVGKASESFFFVLLIQVRVSCMYRKKLSYSMSCFKIDNEQRQRWQHRAQQQQRWKMK